MQREPVFYFCSLIVLLFLLCFQTVMTGAVPHSLFGHDAGIFYDAGWRYYNGIVPHADFYSALGPFIYIYVALSYCLFGLDVNSLAYINALSLGVLSLATWFLLRDRLSWFWLFWVSAFVGLSFMAPFCVRFPYWMHTYASLYNRQCYALVILIMMIIYLPCSGISGNRIKWTSFIVGFLCVLLFFHKVNYFFVGVALLGSYYLIEKEWWLNISWTLAGCCVSLFLFLFAIRFDIAGILGDYSIAAGAKSLYWRRYTEPLVLTLEDSFIGIAPAYFALLSALMLRSGVLDIHAVWKKDRALILLTALGIGCSMVLILSNALSGNGSDHPIIVALCVLICCRISWPRHLLPEGAKSIVWYNSMWVSVAVLGFGYMLALALSIAREPLPPEEPVTEHFESPRAKSLLVYPRIYSGEGFVVRTNDGSHLLERNSVKGGRFMVMEFSNLAGFASNHVSAGGSIFWEAYNNFSPDSHPTPERFTNKVDYILMPARMDLSDTYELFTRLYGDYIATHFTEVDRSSMWLLLRRNSEGPP